MNFLSSFQQKPQYPTNVTRLKPIRGDKLKSKYSIGTKLGEGGCGTVFLLQEKRTKEDFACKVLRKDKTSVGKLYKEIRILQSLRHPNIVQFHEFYENRKEVIIVMNMAKGGELYQVLREHGKFQETNAKVVIKALLTAVSYLQTKLIAHRDIKLENVLLLTDVLSLNQLRISNSDIILSDFGLARQMMSREERTLTRCGSRYYVAPEVWLKRGYGMACDLWSIGVVMYMLLTNTPPFYENKYGKVQPSITLGEYRKPKISSNALSLLKSLLRMNPSLRVTPDEALKSKWFENQLTV